MKMKDPVPEFCDMCGRDLDMFDLDYRVVVEVISGDMRKDPGEDFCGDTSAEIRKLIESAGKHSDAELMDQVYRKMHFKICPECQKEYLDNPIPRNFRNRERDDDESS